MHKINEIEHRTVFGKPVGSTITDTMVTKEAAEQIKKQFANSNSDMPWYPADAGYPNPEQIKAMAASLVERGGKALSKLTSDAGKALKFDQDKLPLNLLSTEAMNQTAAVLKFGAQKYAEHNWRKGFTWSRPLAAAMRHLTAFNDGEDKDPESGLSHIAHAACCLMFILEFEKTHPELDDRYKSNLPPTN